MRLEPSKGLTTASWYTLCPLPSCVVVGLNLLGSIQVGRDHGGQCTSSLNPVCKLHVMWFLDLSPPSAASFTKPFYSLPGRVLWKGNIRISFCFLLAISVSAAQPTWLIGHHQALWMPKITVDCSNTIQLPSPGQGAVPFQWITEGVSPLWTVRRAFSPMPPKRTIN